MIRIITARDELGNPTEAEDFDEVRVDMIPTLLGLRFDKELAALAKDGIFIGVNRWTEAVWKCRKFSTESFNKLREMGIAAREAAEAAGDEPDADEEDGLEALADSEELDLWIVSHRFYTLTVQVGIWAAVNMSGRRTMTLREVYELAARDVENLTEDDFIPDDDIADQEVDAGAGKA